MAHRPCQTVIRRCQVHHSARRSANAAAAQYSHHGPPPMRPAMTGRALVAGAQARALEIRHLRIADVDGERAARAARLRRCTAPARAARRRARPVTRSERHLDGRPGPVTVADGLVERREAGRLRGARVRPREPVERVSHQHGKRRARTRDSTRRRRTSGRRARARGRVADVDQRRALGGLRDRRQARGRVRRAPSRS